MTTNWNSFAPATASGRYDSRKISVSERLFDSPRKSFRPTRFLPGTWGV